MTTHEAPDPDGRPDAGASRRYLTLLFADLSHSTELTEAMEAEHYAALLTTLRDIYERTISHYAGTIVRVQGDGLLAMWGYPRTREDDGRRAVEAAMALRQEVAELQVELPGGLSPSLHTGVHSGLVLIGAGDIERGRFELLGLVPNIAARLSDNARPHEILVSAETLGPARRFFDTDPPRELQVKGFAEPIVVYRVNRGATLSARLGADARLGAPFVGRREELMQMQRMLSEAAGGQARSVCVRGAAGMGKTRLVEQLVGRAARDGWRVLRGYCDSDPGAEPLQPFRHMLQTLGREATSPSTAEEFAALFAQLAAVQPLLLFVDDAQWADKVSDQVLVALRRLSGCRLLLVLSARAGEAMDVAEQTIALGPLSDAEAAEAISVRWPAADPFVAAEIVRNAGGNPLFIEELCHSWARGEGTRRVGRNRANAAWLNHLIESRVQHLSAEQAELARVAAVIGNVIPVWLLQSITGHGESSPVVRALADHDFIFPGERIDTLRFKHSITHRVIYDSVGLHVRQQLHLRVADAIRREGADSGQDESLEALAHHYGAGGNSERAAHYAELAGDKALAASALDRARVQYCAALGALDRLPSSPDVARRWVAIVLRLGLVSAYDPTRSELALTDRAVTLAGRYGDLAMVARARCWQGYVSYVLGDTLTAIAHEQQALSEAEQTGDASLVTQVVGALGHAHTAAAQYERALPLLDQAIDAKRRHRTGKHTNVSLSYSLVCKAYLLGDRGLFTQAHRCFEEALASIVGVHEVGASAHGWRAAVLLWQGRWVDARQAAAESGSIAEATRSLSQLSIARAIGAYADWMLARDPASLQIIIDATAWLEPRESALFRSLNHGWLADGLAAVGRRHEARRHAALALLRRRQRDLLGVAMSYRALARDAAPRNPAAARRYIRLALRTASERDSAHEAAATQLCEAEVEFMHGEHARAADVLARAAAALEQMGMLWHLQQAALLRARFISE